MKRIIVKINLVLPADHVALLWTGATDFSQDGYWTWSQSKSPVKVGTGFRVQGNTGYRVQGTGYRVQGTGYRVQGA